MRIVIALMLVVALTACEAFEKPDPKAVFEDPEALEVTELVIETIRSRDAEALIALSHPDAEKSPTKGKILIVFSMRFLSIKTSKSHTTIQRKGLDKASIAMFRST